MHHVCVQVYVQGAVEHASMVLLLGENSDTRQDQDIDNNFET